MKAASKTHSGAFFGQRSLFDPCPVATALNHLAAAGIEERGAIFTRRAVVDFILDLAGYDAARPLHSYSLLEPSCGEGSFLFPIVDRLLAAYQAHGGDLRDCLALQGCIRAVELHRNTCEKLRQRLEDRLRAAGVDNRRLA